MASDPDQDDLDRAFQRSERSLVPWIIGGALLLLFVGIAVLYLRMPQRGLSVAGSGHIVVLPNGVAWAFLLDGGQIKVDAESVHRLGLKSGPCMFIEGALSEKAPVLEIDSAECSPGSSVVPRITERMGRLGLQFGYWSLESSGQSLADAALTTEIVAAMIEPRADAPQIIPLYRPLFPEALAEIRSTGMPPPLIIHVDRNDAVKPRLDRNQLAAFLRRPEYVLAGAGAKGGWLIRTLKVVPSATLPLESVLIDPNSDPWPTELRNPTLSLVLKEASASSTRLK